jgi:hypothetical protein
MPDYYLQNISHDIFVTDKASIQSISVYTVIGCFYTFIPKIYTLVSFLERFETGQLPLAPVNDIS